MAGKRTTKSGGSDAATQASPKAPGDPLRKDNGTGPMAIVKGLPLPQHPNYVDGCMARGFWRASFKCGRKYAYGQDALNKPFLWEHPREPPDSLDRRKRTTKGPNFVAPIIRKYNDFAFRKPAERDPDGPADYRDLLKDADGHGLSLTDLMRKALRKAQIEQVAYLMPINPIDDDMEIITQADADAVDAAPVIRVVGGDSLINWRKRDGYLIEALLVMSIDGVMTARHMTEETRQDFELKEIDAMKRRDGSALWQVKSAGPIIVHGYPGLPLVPLAPHWDDICDEGDSTEESQASPLAELQQQYWNLSSWGQEELQNAAFSLLWITGSQQPNKTERQDEVKVGNAMALWLSNPDAKIGRLGNDAAAWTSIKEAKQECAENLYAVAGVDPPMARQVKQAKSGVAIAYEFEPLNAGLSALVDACEFAENRVMHLVSGAWGWDEPEPAKYPDDFDLPDYAEELAGLVQALATAQLPSLIRDKVTQRFAKRNLNLTEDEEAELEDQLEARSDAREGAVGAFPPPGMQPAITATPPVPGGKPPGVPPPSIAAPPAPKPTMPPVPGQR